MVGHSQLPPQLSVPDTEINIYHAPGGKATTFFSDERLNEVLTWTHDLCILWLGSNDIREDSVLQEIVNDLVDVVESIEELSHQEIQRNKSSDQGRKHPAQGSNLRH